MIDEYIFEECNQKTDELRLKAEVRPFNVKCIIEILFLSLLFRGEHE